MFLNSNNNNKKKYFVGVYMRQKKAIKYYFYFYRLNITPSQSGISCVVQSSSRSTPARQTPLRGGKRKRTLLEESEERSSSDYSISGTARGDIEITEADPQGRYVKLTNKGNKVSYY